MEAKSKKSLGMLARWRAYPYPKRGNIVITASMASVLLALVLGIPFLTPFLNVLAISLFFYGAMAEGCDRDALFLTLRWALTTFITVAVFTVFLPDRTRDSIPFAQMMLGSFTRWLGTAGAPAPYHVASILLSIGGFLVLSFASGGLGALLAGSAGICGFGYAFAYLMRHGTNLVVTTLAAIPPWYFFAFLSGFLLLPATAHLFYNRYKPAEEKVAFDLRSPWVLAGIGSLILSIIFRLTVAGVWHSFLANSTVW